MPSLNHVGMRRGSLTATSPVNRPFSSASTTWINSCFRVVRTVVTSVASREAS